MEKGHLRLVPDDHWEKQRHANFLLDMASWPLVIVGAMAAPYVISYIAWCQWVDSLRDPRENYRHR